MTEEQHGKSLEPTPVPTVRETIQITLRALSQKEKQTPVIRAFRRAIERMK